MGEPEIEKFEITDYDLENEFNPNRRRHKLTKHQQIYGIWADEGEDSDEDERPVRGGSRRKNYSSSISFVGGGIQQAGKPQEPPKVEEEQQSTSEDEAPVRPAFKGSKSSKGFGKKSSGARSTNQRLGHWEANTKGIGKKLLEKMGYQAGKGLGKNLQGILNPVEASVRKGRGAVGAYGPERKETLIPTVDSEEEEEREFRQKMRQWKKVPEAGGGKVKYIYKTIDEVITEGSTRRVQGDNTQLSKVKVIDMTGPEQKVFSGYHALSNQHSRPLEVDEEREKKLTNFTLPELLHNLDLLVDMTEQHIIRNDREIKYERDKIVNLKHEQEKMHDILKHERKQINSLETILDIIDNLQNKNTSSQDHSLTMDDVATAFQKLQEDFYEEFKIYELGDLAVGIVIPLLQTYLEGWNPLTDRKQGLMAFKVWKDILEDTKTLNFQSEDNKADPYHQLLWDVWMPFVRTAVKEWNVKDGVPMIELIENWLPLLPPWITENILEQLVLPKLQMDVEGWNPLTDRVPIHSWIHPWLPLMGSRLELVYPTIRQKIANALVNWHPSDCSAKIILMPWKDVFPKGTFEAFLIKNILPKLVLSMQEFTVNPHQQILDPWYWIMAWEELLPVATVASLLEKHFFPKWLQVLCAWLGHNPNYDEITQWYVGWKNMFSLQLQNHLTIKDQFNMALDVMDRAVSYPPAPGYTHAARDHMSYLAGVERQREIEAQAKRDFETLAQTIQSTGSLNLSFKDLVERKAAERGLLFVPVPNRYYEAKQVFRFGRLLIYMDKGVLFVQKDQSWFPISLQGLLELAA